MSNSACGRFIGGWEGGVAPSFANSILDRINYHKSMNSSENALNNLSKMNKSMDASNIFALAYLANNPALNEDERRIFNECVKSKAMQEYEMYSKEIKRITEGQ